MKTHTILVITVILVVIIILYTAKKSVDHIAPGAGGVLGVLGIGAGAYAAKKLYDKFATSTVGEGIAGTTKSEAASAELAKFSEAEQTGGIAAGEDVLASETAAEGIAAEAATGVGSAEGLTVIGELETLGEGLAILAL